MENRSLPTVSVFTLGCKVNLYDSDAMLAVLSQAGFDVKEGLEEADIYILNTCAVTAEAEKKSRQAIGRIQKINPAAEIYVCGCASQRDAEQFKRDGVQYIIGTKGKIRLAEMLVAKYNSSSDILNPDSDGFSDDGDFVGNNMVKSVDSALKESLIAGEKQNFRSDDGDSSAVDNEVDSSNAPYCVGSFPLADKYEDAYGVVNLRTRHFIKVQDGCNNFCSYCIVPYLRGRSRSRSLDSIMAEVSEAAKSSLEVVISGVNLSAYGKDIGTSLTDLLRSLKKYDDLRFRLGSLEVGVIGRELLEAAKDLKHFCPHFHLSLQSGSGSTLKAMNRRYTTDQYFDAVKLIREYYPEAAITTDIIVGFPTETEEQFVESMDFARKIAFADIHVFPYSSRKGTVAGKLKTLPAEVLDDRQKRMNALKLELKHNYLLKQIGIKQQVLFETCDPDGYWVGHTPNYVKVYSKNGVRGKIRAVVPKAIYLDGVRG